MGERLVTSAVFPVVGLFWAGAPSWCGGLAPDPKVMLSHTLGGKRMVRRPGARPGADRDPGF